MSEKEIIEKETIEIHDTEYVDRSIPTILYESMKQKDMTTYERVTIQVSDKTSKRAFKTFKKIRDEVK